MAEEYLSKVKEDVVSILGYPIQNVTMDEAIEEFRTMIVGDKLSVVVTANPEILYAACSNEPLTEAIKDSDLVFADGIALLTISKVLKTPFKERVAGIDFAYRACKECAKMGKSVFLLGGKEGVAKKASENLEKEIPGLKIAGTHNGYFKQDQDEEIVKLVNDSNADFLCVAMGFPRQELFLHDNRYKLKAKVGVGIGGSLDVWSGNVKRAPGIYQKLGIEWLYRLICEPQRFSRMAKIPVFMLKAIIKR